MENGKTTSKQTEKQVTCASPLQVPTILKLNHNINSLTVAGYKELLRKDRTKLEHRVGSKVSEENQAISIL